MVGSDALIDRCVTYIYLNILLEKGEPSHLFTGVMYPISRSLAMIEVRCCCVA